MQHMKMQHMKMRDLPKFPSVRPDTLRNLAHVTV